MRLINVDTMKMEEFFDRDSPLYLILSHTWTAEEISFQDYMWLQNYDEELAEGVIDELPPKQRARVMAKAEGLHQRSGYKKVLDLARRTRELFRKHLDGFSPYSRHVYVWVDTCCINKESSAELSEAINSMYSWYERADLCVALLSDVTGVEADPNGEFGKSRWFTRGWTLQELLAPREMVFYNGKGEFIGSKSGLARSIEAVTSIDQESLAGLYKPSAEEGRWIAHSTVAEKMSWAAGRQTTRVEDEAYCLLGIFSVNMPLLYGEGRQAFVRLQQEIIKASEDQTILAWGYNRAIWYDNPLAVFARSPAHFRFCGNLDKGGSIFQAPDIDRDTLKAFEMTNIGLRITLTLFKIREGRGKMYAILPTARRSGAVICMPVIWRQRYNGSRICPTKQSSRDARNSSPSRSPLPALLGNGNQSPGKRSSSVRCIDPYPFIHGRNSMTYHSSQSYSSTMAGLEP